MLFKDLKVGDVFGLHYNREDTFIKISTINDDCDRSHYDPLTYPNNIFNCRKECYGTLAPWNDVILMRQYKGSNDKPEYYQYNDKYDYRILANQIEISDISTHVLVPKYAKDIEYYFLIKKVIFNDPATIVFWFDGTKTVVKCQNGEKFDKEKGLALCFMKKVRGNLGNFNNIFRKWIKPESTAFYDAKHPELGIQNPTPKNKKEFPTSICRIKISDLKLIANYMRRNGTTNKDIAAYSGLSIDTVKRALTGCPVLETTVLKIRRYFNFPIEITRYVED